eukprot:g630.t1
MQHVMIFVQVSSAHKLLFELARLVEEGVMQFDDLNGEMTAFQRRYATQIKKCDEMERVLTYFDLQLQDLGVPLPDGATAAKSFWTRHQTEMREYGGIASNRIAKLERELLEQEKRLRQLNDAHTKLLNEYNQSKELKYVLHASLNFKRGMEMGILPSNIVEDADGDSIGLVASGRSGDVKFNTMMGVINAGTDKISFQRMVFRLTRGLAFLEFKKIMDESSQTPVLFDARGESKTGRTQQVEKYVFTAIFSGHAIRQKILQVADAFGAHVHDVADDETRGDIQSHLARIVEKLDTTERVMKKNRKVARSNMENIAEKYWHWRLTVKLEKSVYHTLNKCDVQKAGYLVAQGWLLADKLETVASIVSQQEGEGNNLVLKDTKKKPPTYFKTNKFTSVFQAMTDTYGVPRYQEANPSLFSCVTFPFLFGVMFGDVGHGTLLLIFALTLVLLEKRLEKMDLGEVGGMLYGGRYMLLLMGFFAVYCGLVYNECFCLALNLFGSKYEKIDGNENISSMYVMKDDPDYKLMGPAPVYAFGIDPTWHVSENELTFINSFKMKTSVILGVAQMTMGIVVKFTNALHFKNRNELYYECIPQMIFMCCLFVYMDLLIFIKWCTDWTTMNDGVPNLINTMINMPLQMGGRGDEPPTYAAGAQDTIQPILLVCAVLSVPAMLFPKPFLEYYAHKREHEKAHRRPAHVLSHGNRRGDDDGDKNVSKYAHLDDDEDDGKATKDSSVDDDETVPLGASYLADDHDDEEEEAHSLGDLFIHQAIETIEFVLGCVSNTASYLRLWALSLAHAELAKTFWDLLMANTINMGGGANFIIVFGGYSMWAAVTVFVLMCMDSLECFLHALRLHWVEFQNKFYKADGYAFTPFQFSPAKIVKESRGRAM